ncbi:MAG: hypothetical protein IPL32_18090 [Chloracidobacterium sp.]|nr:hypothetical protein [Chloracidobacterium sp.]
MQSIVEGQGKSFVGAKNFIQDYIADGLVPASNAVTAYKNLLMRGYSTEQIETVMNALKNASAFGRQASLTMGQAVQSATEGLKNENSILVDNSGVTKNVSMMWKDYAASIGTTVGALTKEQKIAAEVQGILEETRFQMGDAAKLSQTYAGRVSALGVSFTNLKVAIGNSIIPIINAVLPYLKAAIDSLVIFFNQLAQIMNAFFGTNVSMASVADNTAAASDAQQELAENTEKAGKAAKGALAAFDDLNVLQKPEAGNGALTTPEVELPSLDNSPFSEGLTALQDKVSAFKEKFLEFIQPVSEALLRLKESLMPLGETIWSGLKWAWDNILVPLAGWVITDLLPVFLDLLGGAAELLNSILIALQPSWQWFWENMLSPLAVWTGGAVVEFLGWLADVLQRLSDWIETNGETTFLLIEIIGGIAGALWLMNAAVGAINVAIGIYNSVMAIAAVVTGLITLPLLVIIALIVAIGVLIYLLIANWEQLSTTVKQIGFIISYYFQLAADTVKNAFTTSLDAISQKFWDVFTGVKNFVMGIINKIIDAINGMIANITDGINYISESINSIGSIMPGFSPISAVGTYQIPHLATGAVIPPNSEFAAILGDQRSGRNIEAPESLIRQIVREESQGGGSQEITIRFEGSLAALIRELKPYIDQESNRKGASLLKGVS